MSQKAFQVVFRLEPEGGYTAIVPSLPGCISYGESLEEAKEMIKDAIEGYIVSMEKHGEELPDDEITYVSSINITIPAKEYV